MAKQNSHIAAFQTSKLKPNETIHGSLAGWIGDLMGKGEKIQRNGQFILTDERACFYRKGWVGEVFETIPLSKITSVETLSRLGYRVLRLHTSHDELAFKTFEDKAAFDEIYSELEQLRHPLAPTSKPAEPGILDQIGKLGELKNTGILTEEEFQSKKAALLARL